MWSLSRVAVLSIQIALLILIWWLGALIQQIFQLPVSAGVIGLILLLLALLIGIFQLQWIKQGADFMLAELMLLFIPCVVGIINDLDLLLSQGWQLLLSITLGTCAVMVATAYSVCWGFKLEQRLRKNTNNTAYVSGD
ncbi:CidA/LrgA family protein [Acinetobacter indicus]|uniref:CidA/LrgA family protein n=1 Tax=Acinetobacter indicus TaxID=756892 RepID=UPI0013646799|nr:CidA/LrgA family protein [Acinetobacter indicus]